MRHITSSLKLKCGLTLATGLLNKMISDTESGDMVWVRRGDMYGFNSDEFNVAFAERNIFFSNDKKIAITITGKNNEYDMADFYQNDKDWVTVNELKDAIIASCAESAA